MRITVVIENEVLSKLLLKASLKGLSAEVMLNETLRRALSK